MILKLRSISFVKTQMKLNGIFTNIFIRVKTHVTKSDWWGAFDNFRKPITKGNGENLMNSVNRKLLD